MTHDNMSYRGFQFCEADSKLGVCTLASGHDGDHEAWTCGCAGDGRCAEAGALVGSWPAVAVSSE